MAVDGLHVLKRNNKNFYELTGQLLLSVTVRININLK